MFTGPERGEAGYLAGWVIARLLDHGRRSASRCGTSAGRTACVPRFQVGWGAGRSLHRIHGSPTCSPTAAGTKQ